MEMRFIAGTAKGLRSAVLGVVLVATVVASGACLRQLYGVAYRSADRLALSRVDSYLDLTGTQEEFVRGRLKRLHAWHRRRELPAYARTLRRVAQITSDGLSANELDWIFGRVRYFRDRIFARTTPDIVRTLLTLNEEQLQHLERKLAESNEDLEEQVRLPPAKRLQKRKAQTIDYTEDWVGDLSAEQKLQLGKMVAGLPDLSALRLRYRRERQKEFLALLRSGPSEAVLGDWLRTRVAYNQMQLIPSYYRGPLRKSRRAYRKFTLDLDRMLTPQQRAAANARMLQLADDMEAWAR